MIVDASALIAIARNEPAAPAIADVLRSGAILLMSAPTHVETFLVADRHPNPTVSRHVETLIKAARIQIEPVTAEQAAIARRAYQLFGKGSGHRAALDFGDCFSYALAVDKDEPLLFVGDDFTHTDVLVAAY
ncbi:type II toxin-antitoxin system VapC family toxin [Gordonia sp. TBRC 11910]|uniref:Ribonuclease VapC n=1 Tax=Gordonia asplenii TaxID=2725283 RepID=A0A848KMY8_9ACTN|nr:type II toxin-antitoxin system VapC family toxin [Gordonia asplenii]NMN99609.1 type II toxin-antitoxin system VapC family toxin [Gordonia asplenii]